MGLQSQILVDEYPADPLQIPVGIPCKELNWYWPETADMYPKRAEQLVSAMVKWKLDAIVFAHWCKKPLPFDLLLTRLLGVKAFVYVQVGFSSFFVDKIVPSGLKLIPLAYSLADGIICLSETDKLFWSGFNANVTSVHNPITIQPADSMPPLSGHNIIWPGRLHPDKYPKRVAPIMEELIKTVPDAKLLMVGPVEPNDKKELLELFKSKDIANNVIICGPQPESEMINWYKKSDAVLLTSVQEGYPLALAEAQSCGIPSVIYELPHLTLAQSGGVLSVPQGNYKMAAKQLEKLLLDKPYANEVGNKGRLFMQDVAAISMKDYWRGLFSNTTKEPAVGYKMQRNLSKELMRAAWRQDNENEATRTNETEKLANAEKRCFELEAECHTLKAELEAVKGSKSFRLGRAITLAPRWTKGRVEELRSEK